jgi:chemotaxis protein CheX
MTAASPSDPVRHPLPPRLLPQDSGALQSALLGLRGRAVALDARAVAQLSTPCVQVLLAAARSWREDGLALRLLEPFGEMLAVLGHLAVDPAALQSPGA